MCSVSSLNKLVQLQPSATFLAMISGVYRNGGAPAGAPQAILREMTYQAAL